jgi:hypothetical protein
MRWQQRVVLNAHGHGARRRQVTTANDDDGAGGLRDLGCGVTLRIAGPAKLRAIHHLMLIEFEPEF